MPKEKEEQAITMSELEIADHQGKKSQKLHQ